MAKRISYNDEVVSGVLQQLSGIESDSAAKAIFVSDIQNSLSNSSGETVAVAKELNGIIHEILNEYDALVSATRIMISKMQAEFVGAEQGIADSIREGSIRSFPR
jgi:hypothetical protein